MDSKPTFGILLVLIGLAGMWFVVTGQVGKFLTAWRTGTVSPTATNTAANVVGGNAAPLGGSSTSTTTTNLNPFALPVLSAPAINLNPFSLPVLSGPGLTTSPSLAIAGAN